MKKQIIGIGSNPNDGNGDNLRTAFGKVNDNFSEIYPITESVTKTVAADGMPAGVQDFDTFHEAMNWACSLTYTNNARVTLNLADGTHYCGGADSTSNGQIYYIEYMQISIESISTNREDVKITFPDEDYGTSYVTMFCVQNIGRLYTDRITMDATVGGLALANMTAVYVFNGGYATLARTGLWNFTWVGLHVGSLCRAYIWDIHIDNCKYGLSSGYSGEIRMDYGYAFSIIENCDIAIDVYSSFAKISIEDPLLELTNNTVDYSQSINVITPVMTYITDGTVPLMMSESFGTTAERPDSVQDGFNYFDSTLGKPIWYDGTNWVDATGATV